MPQVISVLQNGVSNVGSVCNSLHSLDLAFKVVRTASELEQAQVIIFPGVGAFGAAMQHLTQHQLIPVLHQKIIREKIPFLGICLGLQLLFESSEESPHQPGLGWLKGQVKKLASDPPRHRVPNMGWCALNIEQPQNALLHALPLASYAYFVHSYAAVPLDRHLVSLTARHGSAFVAGVCAKNIHAFQFHPEKSGPVGLALLRAFAEWSAHV